MIVFDLICDDSHRFEAWFRSSADYDHQKTGGLLECPFCGSISVKKALMAPNVATKSNRKSDHAPDVKGQSGLPPAEPSQMPAKSDDKAPQVTTQHVHALMQSVTKHVEENFDNVGDNFSEEARRIHYGEADERGIYGNATAKDVKDLVDEGIDILPLPGKTRTDA